MSKKTRAMTLSALFAAFCTITLYIASVWPTGRFGLVAFSSLFAAAAVIEAGLGSGVSVYIISSALGMLLLPDKAAPLLYLLFFGYYPVVKSLIEKLNGMVLQWVLKLLVFNASFTIIWVLLRTLIFDFGDNMPSVALFYLAGNVIFILFDYGFTKVIWFYINRISRH